MPSDRCRARTISQDCGSEKQCQNSLKEVAFKEIPRADGVKLCASFGKGPLLSFVVEP